jgi:hypothetical protein
MKLTALELAVIVDALRGSLVISDNGAVFAYTETSRKLVIDHITEIMRLAVIELENIGK